MIDLQNTDCVEYLQGLKDNSQGMVLVDPPYFIGFDGGKGWDSQWKTEDEYLNWCREWTTECVRVLEEGRMLVVFGTLKTDTFLRYKLEILNSFPELTKQDEIIWSYDWGGRTKKNFARKHEFAWCYSKGKDFLFNADSIREPYKMKENVRKTATNNPLGKIPTLVWQKNNHTTSKEYAGWHPTQKPLSILDRAIKAYTNVNDNVLDCFSGSGSTMISATRTGRNFNGSEIDKEYFDKSKERLVTLLPEQSEHMKSLFEAK